jgi:chromate transport protein ChrA
MVLFAYGAGAIGGPFGAGLLHGLKLVAVAIVAQAVWGMARTLCPDRERASIAALSALIILFSTSSIAQMAPSRWAASWAYGSAAAPRRQRKGIFICRSRGAPGSRR